MNKTKKKAERRNKIKTRIRSTVAGTAERPRLSVYKSNKYTYMNIVDDSIGATLVSGKTEKNIENAKKAGSELAKSAQDKGIQKVVFDRSGYKYHGIIKAVAEGAREGGLQF